MIRQLRFFPQIFKKNPLHIISVRKWVKFVLAQSKNLNKRLQISVKLLFKLKYNFLKLHLDPTSPPARYSAASRVQM